MFDFFEEVFEWGSDAVGTAFGWLGDNPQIAAGLASGAAKGVAGYMAAQEESKSSLALEELRQRRDDKRHYAEYASPSGYVGNLTADGGTLTQGLLAKQMRG